MKRELALSVSTGNAAAGSKSRQAATTLGLPCGRESDARASRRFVPKVKATPLAEMLHVACHRRPSPCSLTRELYKGRCKIQICNISTWLVVSVCISSIATTHSSFLWSVELSSDVSTFRSFRVCVVSLKLRPEPLDFLAVYLISAVRRHPRRQPIVKYTS